MRKILSHIKNNVLPPITPVVGNGVAYYQMRDLEKVVDQHMRCAFTHDEENGSVDCLPDGFSYVDYQRLTPEEQFAIHSKNRLRQKQRSRMGRTAIDISKTDVYLCRFNFVNKTSKGEDNIQRYIAIPFARPGGLMHIKDSLFMVNAVMRTRGLARLPNEYFIKLPSIMLSFQWEANSFYVNGVLKHCYLAYSRRLHVDGAKASAKFLPAIALWIFAKYGLFETMRRYLNCEVRVFDNDDPELKTIDQSVYSLCNTQQPKRWSTAATITVVIKTADLTPEAMIVIGTVLYVAKAHPLQVTADNINEDKLIGTEEMPHPRLWQQMVGRVLWKDGESNLGRLVELTRSYLGKFERRIDKQARQELLFQRVECSTIYDLLFHSIVRMANRSPDEYKNCANLWGRYLTTSEYVMKDLINTIYEVHHALIKMGPEQQPDSKIRMTFNKMLYMDKIYRINSGHGEVSSFMTASDNMLLSVAINCIDQANVVSVKGRGEKVLDVTDPTHHLHASKADVSSISNFTKKRPTQPSKLNPRMRLTGDYQIQTNPDEQETIAALARDITSKGVK